MSRRIATTLLFVFFFSSLPCSRPAAEGRTTPGAALQIIRVGQLRNAVALPSSEQMLPLVTESDEGRGEQIVDGQQQRLAAGDVVVLPARVTASGPDRRGSVHRVHGG